MSNWPTSHHHHTYDHLQVSRFSIAAVAMFGHRWTMSFEVGACDVEEHQLRLELEQVAKPMVERHFDGFFVQLQMIERAIPTLQLNQVDLYPTLILPTRQVAAAGAITDVIGFQPGGQRMFAARIHEPAREQNEQPAP